MSIARSSRLVTSTLRLLCSQKTSHTQLRKITFTAEMPQYRAPKPKPKWGSHEFNYYVLAELGGGFMWWWILYHFYTDYEHLTGHCPYPNPNEWTDEELGISEDVISKI